MIDYEVRGGEDTLLRVRAQQGRIRDSVRDALSDAVNHAEKIMQAKVPRDSGRLAATIRKSGIIYSPGGAGGGGSYEVELVAGEGIPYLNVLVEGSGVHGAYGSSLGSIVAGAGNIRGQKVRDEWLPRSGARVMVFTPKGETKPIFRRSVRGQEGQTDWIEAAQAVATAIVRERLERLDAVHE